MNAIFDFIGFLLFCFALYFCIICGAAYESAVRCDNGYYPACVEEESK